ncbi:hypothetical protein [Streptomyces sp. NPDC056821]|uniref:hypothetical protein n=1 Tax=Streptomyces sp. NPDC056821 TaxID=3345952 RepID=UPI0036ADCFD6
MLSEQRRTTVEIGDLTEDIALRLTVYVGTEENVPFLNPQARLAQLDRDATRHVEDHRPEKTRTGYGADWNAWLRFCTDSGLPPTAVRSGTLVLFVEWCWLHPARPPRPGRPPGPLTAPSTIDRRLSGVVVTARRQHKL